MSLIDNIIIGVVLISMLIGLYRGFFPEALSLLTWIVAMWVAWKFAPLLEPQVATKIPEPLLSLWVARFVLFAGMLLVGGLVNEVVSMAIEKTGLSGTNRMLGLVFGLGRGLLVFGVLVIFAQILDMTEERWWQESRLIPVGESIADTLRELLPETVVEQIEERLAPAESG